MELTARGVEVLRLPDVCGRVDLKALMAELSRRSIISILAEGGATLNGALLEAGLVNRVVTFIAPKLVGGAASPSSIGGHGIGALDQAIQLGALSVRRFGPDIAIEAEVINDRFTTGIDAPDGR